MVLGNPKFINQDKSCPGLNMVVDLPLEELQVILWWERRVGKRIPFPGCLLYEKSWRGISP